MLNLGAQHVWVDGFEPGTRSDRPDPPVRSAAVEPLPIPAAQDRALVAFADREARGTSTGRRLVKPHDRVSGTHTLCAEVPAGATRESTYQSYAYTSLLAIVLRDRARFLPSSSTI